ncbi:hypothetical protein [Kocuria massiliensis]|uniref:hypothetical protein n=1 Tax=Kocuria massiliensis TaxID=1926282 RepID=UPI000A1C818C|nr:hypothetical protein [Kocuria massiliensis]MCT1368541.1 hypothetical protein [Rothia sp. p3-SID1597]
MPRETEPTTVLSERLRDVFDRHVMNYGAYNLVYTTGIEHRAESPMTPTLAEDSGHFIVGYRRAPSEIVIVPMDTNRMHAIGVPVAIDNTNLVQAAASSSDSFSLETTSGAVFDLKVSPLSEVDTPHGTEILEQEADREDFLDYIREISAF